MMPLQATMPDGLIEGTITQEIQQASAAPRRRENGQMTTMTAMEDLKWTALPVNTLVGSWRILLGSRLQRAGIPAALAGDIILSASELIANASEHAPPDTSISLSVRFGVSWVCLGVWDASNEPPRPRPMPELDGDPGKAVCMLDENGRGLQIVVALATEHKVEWTPPNGKWVWCRFDF